MHCMYFWQIYHRARPDLLPRMSTWTALQCRNGTYYVQVLSATHHLSNQQYATIATFRVVFTAQKICGYEREYQLAFCTRQHASERFHYNPVARYLRCLQLSPISIFVTMYGLMLPGHQQLADDDVEYFD